MVMHFGIKDAIIIALRKEEGIALLRTKQSTCTLRNILIENISFLCLTNSRVL